MMRIPAKAGICFEAAGCLPAQACEEWDLMVLVPSGFPWGLPKNGVAFHDET